MDYEALLNGRDAAESMTAAFKARDREAYMKAGLKFVESIIALGSDMNEDDPEVQKAFANLREAEATFKALLSVS